MRAAAIFLDLAALLLAGILSQAQVPGNQTASPGPPLQAAPSERVTPAPAHDLAVAEPPRSELRWGPPGIDEIQPATIPGTACPQQQVVEQAGKRLNELVDNISQFDAVEEVVHEEHNRHGKPRSRTRKEFAYLATISRPQAGVLKIDEERQNRHGPDSAFPGGIATLGLPGLAFVFHPSMREGFEIACEGLGEWQGAPAWLLHFQQREHHPSYLLAYTVGEQEHLAPLKGRAWVAAGSFQIVHMEAELVRPMPKIQLLKHHQIVDYGAVLFKKSSAELWLPRKAELYFHFRGHRYYRRHLFHSFRLFAVDVNQKVTLPPTEDLQ